MKSSNKKTPKCARALIDTYQRRLKELLDLWEVKKKSLNVMMNSDNKFGKKLLEHVENYKPIKMTKSDRK